MSSLAMLLAVLIWSSSTIGSKAALDGLAISEVASVRFFFAAVILWAIVILGRQRVAFPAGSRRALLMGALDPGLVTFLILSGLSLTVAVNVAVFWSLMPLLMPILGRIVLREAVSVLVLSGAAIAFCGTLLLVWQQSGQGQGSFLGDGLAIAGVLCACANQLIARRVAQSLGRPVVTTAVQMSVALLVAAIALFGFERPADFPYHITGSEYSLLFYLAIATASPFFLYNFALQRLPVGRASLFSCLSAPVALPMAALFLGESITKLDVLAVAIVVAGVALPALAELPAIRRKVPRLARLRRIAERPVYRPGELPREPVAADLWQRPLESFTFVVFDTETTGLQPSAGDEIVQIAGVKIEPGWQLSGKVFEELVNPGRPIPPRATAIHGISDDMVAGQPGAVDVLARFHEFARGSVLVAHNAAFDMRFLELKEETMGYRFDNPVLDTLLLSAVLCRRKRDHGLDAIAERFDLSVHGRHSALGDALVTAQIFLRLNEIGRGQGMHTLADAIRISRKARAFRRLQRQFRGAPASRTKI